MKSTGGSTLPSGLTGSKLNTSASGLGVAGNTTTTSGMSRGVLPPKKKASEMLEEETKKMEDKVEQVKKLMEIEKEKRNALMAQRKPNKDGTMWRSATTGKPVNGYTQQVLNHHR